MIVNWILTAFLIVKFTQSLSPNHPLLNLLLKYQKPSISISSQERKKKLQLIEYHHISNHKLF